MQLDKLPSIWNESPLTLSHSRNAITIDRSKRFEIDSIYYRDDPTKPKKKVDQFMFPMQILHEFRKNIRDASKSKEKLKIKRYSSHDEEEIKPLLSHKASSITNKLYKKPDPLYGSRDFFGNRASFHENQIKEICRLPCFQTHPKKNSPEKIYITAANRLDLARPINFNPGPGAYLKETVLTQKSKQSSSLKTEESILRRKKRQSSTLQPISNQNPPASKNH